MSRYSASHTWVSHHIILNVHATLLCELQIPKGFHSNNDYCPIEIFIDVNSVHGIYIITRFEN